jgi:predicted RNA-binding Zn-ribbon protein involved in translation (DUF1610 family)
LATSEGSISWVLGQSKLLPELPCCHVCGTQLVLEGPPSKRSFDHICPNCGAKCELRCSWCKNLFTPTQYRVRSENHFCCDEHALQFGNERRNKQKSAERAARRAIPLQCARKGSIYAPGVRENPELLKDCPVIFTPRRNGQDFCSRECQRIQWWVENYDELSGKVKEKSRRQYEKRVATVTEAERVRAQAEAARAELAELRAKAASSDAAATQGGEGGRPREKEKQFREGAALYPSLKSWAKVAMRVTPEDYLHNPRKAADSMRLGAKYYLQN